MGCTQSKANEQVVDPAATSQPPVDQPPVSTAAPEDSTPANSVEATPAVEAEAEAETPVEEKPEVKAADGALNFVPGEVTFNEHGIAFYNFDGSNPADPSKDIHVSKRYSEFKTMHTEIAKLMASEKNVPADQQDKFQTYAALPALPKANAVTFLRGRGNKMVVEEREAQFVKILNAIARHPIAFQSETFTGFLSFQSKTDDVMHPNGIEFSITELSIAKHPGGADVAPSSAMKETAKEEPTDDYASTQDSEPATERKTEAAIANAKTSDGTALVFEADKAIAKENGVVFYAFVASNPADPAKEVHISKRFSEFKAMHVEIAKLMASEQNVPAEQQDKFQTYPALPALPQANALTFLRGRGNEKLIEQREAQFATILNAIARHPVAFQSEVFAAFLA
ncbi:hypothetical protein BBJ28_00022887 [Nothophytophthora sp. Chile5]|nr:hypothetical protein BBJ28_00022887 [Nothophytophthora sp. Chile5]